MPRLPQGATQGTLSIYDVILGSGRNSRSALRRKKNKRPLSSLLFYVCFVLQFKCICLSKISSVYLFILLFLNYYLFSKLLNGSFIF